MKYFNEKNQTSITQLAKNILRPPICFYLRPMGSAGQTVTIEYFDLKDNQIVILISAAPSMEQVSPMLLSVAHSRWLTAFCQAEN